jgi:hypothetical protein
MNCLNSFFVTLSRNSTYSTVGTNVKTWTNLGDTFFTVEENTLNSTFNIQGFKNVNIHGFKMVGQVSSPLLGSSVIVNDWVFNIAFNGQPPILGGSISPNTWSANLSSPTWNVSKYIPYITFESPIQSVQSFTLGTFSANGYGVQTPGSVSLAIGITFEILYTFEGE